MKQRLLVLNGQRLVQTEQGGQWNTSNVEKAGPIKPGIYNIYLATSPDKSKRHDGIILYIDDSKVYQQIGKGFIQHDRKDFDQAPDISTNSSVKYVDGKAQVTDASVKLGKKIS